MAKMRVLRVTGYMRYDYPSAEDTKRTVELPREQWRTEAEVLKFGEAEIPVAGEGEVLVKMTAVSVFFPDHFMLVGRYQYHPNILKRGPVLGGNGGIGYVEAVGAGVTNFQEGDRVIVLQHRGTFAQYVAFPEHLMFHAPAEIPDGKLIQVGGNLDTAWDAAQRAAWYLHKPLGPDTLVGVTGANGGVGGTMIQVAKYHKAPVIAMVRNKEKGEIALANGPDAICFYGDARDPDNRFGDFKDGVRAAAAKLGFSGDHPVNVMVDNVGGPLVERGLYPVTAGGNDGAVFGVGFAAAGTDNTNVRLNAVLMHTGNFVSCLRKDDESGDREFVQEILDVLEAGDIDPAPAQRFEFDAAVSAFEAIGSSNSQNGAYLDFTSIH